MMTVSAGRPLIELIALAYQADRPVMLHGRHGIGKSEILAEAAERLGIDLIVRDLSLMEPPDLVGLPRIGADGRTHYAAPAFLPTEGRGLLVFEELNRSPKYMQAPCLQLLTARRLNDYVLPKGWLPCAAVNDALDGYQVDELDEALLSRFLQVWVVPEVTEWLAWARDKGEIHRKVLKFVESSPGIFDEPASNPRAWTWASDLLNAWEKGGAIGERHQETLVVGLSGLLGDKWALAFMQFSENGQWPLDASQIIDFYPARRAALRGWVSNARLDLVKASLELVKRNLQRQQYFDEVVGDPKRKSNVEAFFSDLPADLKKQLREWLAERGFKGLTVSEKAR